MYVETAAIDLALRWIHLVAAIIWLGHNYVNVILRPRFVPLAVAGPAQVLTEDVRGREWREHAVFRYASIVTWTAGVLMLWRQGILVDAFLLQGYPAVIGVGAWIGTLMMLNVWLVLWPHQKKVLGFVPAPPEERARCARITFLSSRTNTMLSIPLLVLMAAGSHGGGLFV
jgi:uncharacterized membrane protein